MELIEIKVDELVQFFDEVQRCIDEVMRMKQEFEEVCLFVEIYIENFM